MNPTPMLARIALAGLLVHAADAQTAAGAPAVPDGLTAGDWSGIQAAYEADRHAAYAMEGGYGARNPGQQWRTRFDGRGSCLRLVIGARPEHGHGRQADRYQYRPDDPEPGLLEQKAHRASAAYDDHRDRNDLDPFEVFECDAFTYAVESRQVFEHLAHQWPEVGGRRCCDAKRRKSNTERQPTTSSDLRANRVVHLTSHSGRPAGVGAVVVISLMRCHIVAKSLVIFT